MEQMCIPKDILDALAKAFASDEDIIGRNLWFLTTSLKDGVAYPYITALQSVLNNPGVFQNVAERFANDTKTAEKDPQYRQFMHDIWTNFLKDDLAENSDGQMWALPKKPATTAAHYAFMRSLAQLPRANYIALENAIKSLANPGIFASSANSALTAARSAGPVVRVGLVTVFLAIDIIKNIRRWWREEITGKRCVKNIMDNGVAVAAGLAGGAGGASIGASMGAFFSPAGAAVGAIGGAVLGSVVIATGAQVLSDKLTQWVFGLPKSEALENAYCFLNVRPTASNTEINSCYRHLALKYHPDKNGDPDGWIRLQYSLAVLREARGAY